MIFLYSNIWFYGYAATGETVKREIALRLAAGPDISLSSQNIISAIGIASSQLLPLGQTQIFYIPKTCKTVSLSVIVS